MASLVRCGMCHTPANEDGSPDMDFFLAGAPFRDTVAPNLTPDEATGLGLWTEEEIADFLATGIPFDGVWTSGIDNVIVDAFVESGAPLVPIVGGILAKTYDTRLHQVLSLQDTGGRIRRTCYDRSARPVLQVGLDVMRGDADPVQVATLLCRILLEGIATGDLSDRRLDASPTFQAADTVVNSWGNDRDGLDDRQAHIRAVARAEFGRRGYEGTTIRDIAAAAGMGTGTVYRMIGSKDQLLASIMQEFGEKVGMGWTEVMRSGGSPVEKLDALSWVNTNALARFGDEFRIQLAWMRQSPPDTPNPGWLFTTRLRQMKSLLTTGIRSGQIVISTPSREMLARCVIAVGWIPENMLAEMGPRESLLHVRDTLLRGVVARR